MPRLFTAIDLPERIRDDISAMYAAIPGAKWTEDAHLHLTLTFIGEVAEDKASAIQRALSTVKIHPFSLNLKGIGFFPPRKVPRVLWCGVSSSEELLRLQGKIQRTLELVDAPVEQRKYTPHITMARLNNAPAEKLGEFMSTNALFQTEPFSVTEFHLYSSTLRREGALHIKEASYKLEMIE